MPRKKYTKRKRSWRRKRKYVMTHNVIPQYKVVKMRYGAVVTINPGAGLTSTHIFRANGCFDPDLTGTGHQPLGFDEWKNFYNHYTVLGSRMKVTFMPRGVGVNDAALCAISVKADTTPIGGPLTPVLEQTGVTYGWSGNYNSRALVLTKNFSAKKHFSLKDIADNDHIRAAISEDPVEQAYFHVMCAPQDASSDTNPINAAVVIDYIVRFSERKTLTQS